MHAMLKISMDSYTNLMELSHFFPLFLNFLLFLPFPKMVLLAFLTPIEYRANIFTQLFTVSPGSFLSVNRQNRAHHCIHIISAHALFHIYQF